MTNARGEISRCRVIQRKRVLLWGMMMDAAGQRSERGRILSKCLGNSKAVLAGAALR
jgi:hypothetical protein